ncbi:HlyD family efflux transporter periplasmic adaptor subunit [Luteibacter yeojuensis]|uniref:HlyD family efflux transporter periplasmic adaptor subunit n=1 Tax=Luteibacter yeojuensis TaxID=345309 RepID=A0A7X5QSQ0_9GAMM|nr:HlyD family efflux transporter periplasmic adaptor subunit [Luteibacter yeojuensis]NID14728.1 HlyD family efflux transporter periplasmic adaptor subunit [Luteibacter yeojuensis]
MVKPKRPLFLGLIVLVLLLGLALWWLLRPSPDQPIVLHGNIDIRQVSLAFKVNERIAGMRVEEGDRVTRGQVLATLDTRTLKLRLAKAEAQVGVQDEVLRRLEAGNRPQEIAQTDANMRAAQADARMAHQTLERLRSISRDTGGRAVSREDLDQALAAATAADAKVDSLRKAHELSVAGPRKEDVDEARAQREAALAEAAVARQELADAELKAPIDAVVRSRLLEPGDMASPQRPVYALAVLHPKWVRAYVSEANLSRIKPGQAARVTTDSAPDRPIAGRIGYIASVSEFTPKNVETEDLRTSLVYEVRVNVDDPEDRLRLGMPATVRLPGTVAAKP